MRNFMKILCVVLALVVAMSAASCSLTKQYSYKTDDVELPIGVYIYYLRNAYYQAQTLAQKSDKYDSAAGTYDGSKSFLKLEITDEDGKTAVAEDWIKDKAAEYMNEAVAIYYEYNKLGATIDEAMAAEYKSSYRDYWDNGYEYYGYQQPALKDTYEPLGIGFDSFFQTEVTINMMRDSLFTAEYGKDGPQAVTDEELHKYYENNYSSYHYFSANLFTTEDSVSSAMSEEDVKKYTDAFNGYADAVKGGAKLSDQLTAYNETFSASATVSDKIDKIDEKNADDLQKAVLELKDGEAKVVTTGADASQVIYVVYKEPIADTTEKYFSEDGKRESVLSAAKSDSFKELLQTIAAAIDVKKSSACDDYKPSMFES